MKTFMITAISILVLCLSIAHAQDSIEKEKIQFLISSIENLADAKFIRNGSEYDGKAAASHLRLKLKSVGDRVKTADDFIRMCASKSSMSEKPYMIKFSDGKVVNSEDYFRTKLAEFKPSVQ